MSIARLQEALSKMPQAECRIDNYFSDGLYGRLMTIPKGACVVGARHKTRHLFMVVKGTCLISDDKTRVEAKAPYITETLPGMKRAFTALTETQIMTFHVTEETDPLKIGEQITEKEQGLIPEWKKLRVVE